MTRSLALLATLSYIFVACSGNTPSADKPDSAAVVARPVDTAAAQAGHFHGDGHDHDHDHDHDQPVPPVPAGSEHVGPAPDYSNARTVTFKGTIVAVDPGPRMLMIDHEAIPDYLPAQTTQFLADKSLVDRAAPKMAATFTLRLGGGEGMIVAME